MCMPWQGRSFIETVQTRTAMPKPLDSDPRKTFPQCFPHLTDKSIRCKVPVSNIIPIFVAHSTVPTSQDCLTIRRRAADSGECPPVPIQIAPFLGNVVGSRQYPQTYQSHLGQSIRACRVVSASPRLQAWGLLTGILSHMQNMVLLLYAAAVICISNQRKYCD